MGSDYLDLYDVQQDIGDGSGGDYISVSAVGNINIAGTAPKYKPEVYRTKVSKGKKKGRQNSKPTKTSSVARPDEWEYNNPGG